MASIHTHDSYYVSVTGEITVVGLTDQHGEQVLLEFRTRDAHEFFKRGELGTREPRTVGGVLMKALQMRTLRKRMFPAHG